jgi:hypothetical protein
LHLLLSLHELVRYQVVHVLRLAPLLLLNPLLHYRLEVVLLLWRQVMCVLNQVSQLLVSQLFKSLKFLSARLIISFVHIALLVFILLLLEVLPRLVIPLLFLLGPLPKRFLCVVLPLLRAQVIIRGLVRVLALFVVDLSALGLFLLG